MVNICLLSPYPVFLCNYIDFPMLGKYMHVIDLHVRTFLELGRPSKCQKKNAKHWCKGVFNLSNQLSNFSKNWGMQRDKAEFREFHKLILPYICYSLSK